MLFTCSPENVNKYTPLIMQSTFYSKLGLLSFCFLCFFRQRKEITGVCMRAGNIYKPNSLVLTFDIFLICQRRPFNRSLSIKGSYLASSTSGFYLRSCHVLHSVISFLTTSLLVKIYLHSLDGSIATNFHSFRSLAEMKTCLHLVFDIHLVILFGVKTGRESVFFRCCVDVYHFGIVYSLVVPGVQLQHVS